MVEEIGMKFGYMGKILMVDLSTRVIREEIIPDHVYEQYLSSFPRPALSSGGASFLIML